HRIGTLEEGLPFDVCIAKHTGIWGAAREVFVHEIVYHIVAKLLAYVHDEVAETEVHGDSTGIIDRVKRAAAGLFFRAADGRVVPCFHGNAHDLIALLMQHHSGHGTVYTAAHRYQYFSFFAHR